MARYIDADKFISELRIGQTRSPFQICYTEFDVKVMIDMQPTVDVVEVKHGEYKTKGAWHIECSVCGHTLVHICEAQNYCPNCGAKMDRESGD